jgi:VanZ family protein
MQTPAQQRPFETVMALIRITTIVLGVYWLAIFTATHLPTRALPTVGSDKFYHVVAFAGLGFLLCWASSLFVRGALRQAVLVLVIAALYASFDEWSQRFVAGRHPDVEDFAADMCGAALGLACFMIVRAILTRESRLADELS